nr:YegP family protein [uncultured Arsenicibacter sp.]
MGKFVISTRKNGEYQFNLKATNGQVILASEGYTTKAACENGIESVKKNAADDARFDRKESSNGKFYFNLKAGNGQVIGSSEMYETVASRDNGIESVKKNAPEATVVDETE